MHPEERDAVLRMRYKQLQKRPRGWSQAEIVGKLEQEFALSKTRIYNILGSSLGKYPQ